MQRMLGNRPRRVRRFSLIEIMIVVVIIGMIMGLVGPNIMKSFEKAKHKTAKAQVKILANAAKDYYIDMNEYPARLEELVQKSGNAKWDGPYLDPPEIPVDPWGEEYSYSQQGTDGRPEITYSRASESPDAN